MKHIEDMADFFVITTGISFLGRELLGIPVVASAIVCALILTFLLLRKEK